MTKQIDFFWCSANLFRKLLLVSVLLQSSLGFNFNEDEYAAAAPAFYHYFEDVPWKIPQKMPRGYMYPVPRVGRRQTHEEKRQSMIPQPRIGRELEASNELDEILYNIQKFLPGVKFQSSAESLKKAMEGKTLPEVPGDVIAKFLKYPIEESGNSALANKDTTLSSKEIGGISRLREEEYLNLLQDSDPDHKIGVSFAPKEDNIFSKEAKNSGFDIFEDDKRDGFLPLGRADKAKLLTALEDKKQIGGLIAYPRLGRHVWELHSSLFPFSGSRSIVIEPELSDYDLLLGPEAGTAGLEDILTDAFLTSQPVVKKSRSLKLIPRIGRKKRSIDEGSREEKPEESENAQEDLDSEEGKSLWHNLQGFDDGYRYNVDKRNLRSKNAFIPRIGKKSFDGLDVYDDKRAVAFTPRIGRASLIPRIGRSDPRFRLKSRGAFVPRIGRRAALIPRIGRSANRQEETVESK